MSLVKAAAGLAAIAYADASYGLGYDFRLADLFLKGTAISAYRSYRGKISLWSVFEDSANQRPDELCYWFEGKSWTWNEVALEARRISNYLISKGFHVGDRFAFFLPNKVSFIFAWLGCLHAGVTPAFINYSLTGKGLLHCISIAEARGVLFDPELEAELVPLADELRKTKPGFLFIRFDDGLGPGEGKEKPAPKDRLQGADVELFDRAAWSAQSSARVPDEWRKDITQTDPACLIYTSGTTGLPKAALFSHGRATMAGQAFSRLNRLTPKDRVYTAMPLYHSSAAILCVGASWCGGSSVAVGRHFSARRFFNEAREANATVIQYIGEIARYLLSTPPSDKDKDHNIRMAYGNGMRPDVWEKFRDRFGIPVISEFYASTEGNGSLLNYNTGPFGKGAVGRFGSFIRTIKPDVKVVQVDAITEEPARTANGFCIECPRDTPGELLMRIHEDHPSGKFQGYAGNKAATEKKIIRNVFVKGDAYFRTGDLMRMDKDGHFFFCDRLGDTFRWHGENVSTADVAEALGEVVDEANVYGVLLPNHEGRAGCAAIPATSKIDFSVVARHATKRLPKYAVPIFLRIVPEMTSTGTVKQLKVGLRNEGVDPNKVSDPLYWLPPGGSAYLPLDKKAWAEITSGRVKL